MIRFPEYPEVAASDGPDLSLVGEEVKLLYRGKLTCRLSIFTRDFTGEVVRCSCTAKKLLHGSPRVILSHELADPQDAWSRKVPLVGKRGCGAVSGCRPGPKVVERAYPSHIAHIGSPMDQNRGL